MSNFNFNGFSESFSRAEEDGSWFVIQVSNVCTGCGGLMVSALDSGASAPGSSPGLGHCVVFLGKTLHSHGASLYPGI